jgi:hypothetical protein
MESVTKTTLTGPPAEVRGKVDELGRALAPTNTWPGSRCASLLSSLRSARG